MSCVNTRMLVRESDRRKKNIGIIICCDKKRNKIKNQIDICQLEYPCIKCYKCVCYLNQLASSSYTWVSRNQTKKQNIIYVFIRFLSIRFLNSVWVSRGDLLK